MGAASASVVTELLAELAALEDPRAREVNEKHGLAYHLLARGAGT